MHQLAYYAVICGLSFLLTLLYVFIWHKQFAVHLTVVFILIPLANLGYYLLYAGHSAGTATAMLKIVYFSGCFLPWLTMMCVMELCRIPVRRSLRMLTLLLSAAVYMAVLSIGYLPLFYRSLRIERLGEVWIQHKVYGPFHTVHYIIIVLYLIADMAAIFYSYRKKNQVSRRVLLLLFLPIPVTTLGYIAGRYLLPAGYEFTPISYLLAQFIYLMIAQRMILYNVSEMVIESMVQAGETGFITVDSEGRYLGSNDSARRFLPELCSLTVDRPIWGEEALKDTVIDWLTRFRQNPEDDKSLFARSDPADAGEERFYSVDVNVLNDGRRARGYQIFLQDDTQNQKYIRLLDRYNADLQEEVETKTERIVVMHDRLILGMAAMVESRDNSTGGHIRRTSEGVRRLVEAMREDGSLALSDIFCKNLIKAAPMHDLGKIAVDDAILRKPGRFTPEEFEKMKAHAAEGARIVHEILRDTDDEDFRRIAENMAHYHHERWDGSGYPDGLKGGEIPLEARIMAIADVYDALVSKRVYKEEFSFEKADRIIMEGMGTQFDPGLQKYYIAARPRLEAFYATENR